VPVSSIPPLSAATTRTGTLPPRAARRWSAGKSLDDREAHQDRTKLIDHHESIGVRAHDVSAANEQPPRTSGDRRTNRGVLEIETRVVDRRLVRLHRRLHRFGRRLRLVGLRLRHVVLLGQRLVSLGVALKRLRLGLVASERRFGLTQRGRDRTRVELEENLSGLDLVPLVEQHGVERTADLRQNRHRLHRLDDAVRLERQRREILLTDAT
jgi:hypothetical protein